MIRPPCVTLRTNSSQLRCSQLTCYSSLFSTKCTSTVRPGFRSRYCYGLRAGRSAFEPRCVAGIFSLLHNRSDRPWGPPSFTYNEYRRSFLGIKRSERGTDNSLPSTARVKNDRSYTLLSPLCLSTTVLGDRQLSQLF